MKKGNVDVRKGINQTYRISYADTLLFVLHEDSVKDLHSLLSELLETETKTSNLGFIRQYLGAVPPERRFTAKELWEVFNTFAPPMSKETEKKLVEAIKGIETETVKEECRCRSGELKTGGKWASWSKDNCPVHPDKSPFDKEEPTTPEESICIECKKRPAIVGVLCDFCRSLSPEECQPTTPECSHEMPTWASSCNCSCRTAQVSNSYEVPTPTTTPEKYYDGMKSDCDKKFEESKDFFEGASTPEKGCCDCFGKEPIALGVVLGGGEFKCQCKCHKEKLPSERIFEIREKGGKEVLPSNGEEYYVMPIAKAIMMYLDEQYKKK